MLEQTRRIDTIVLDKTGTVTEGRMELAGVAPLNGATRAEVLRLAGAVEAASEHPIAQRDRRRGRAPSSARCRAVDGLPQPAGRRRQRRRRRATTSRSGASDGAIDGRLGRRPRATLASATRSSRRAPRRSAS